jgi:beta-phosphoglucomutase-like phosphatase (HAD superfamily)
MTLSNSKVVVFDFDGVIVAGSEYTKETAWGSVLAPYGVEAGDLLQEASTLFGFGKKGDRFDMLRYIFQHLGVDDVETEVQKVGGMFDAFLQDAITKEGPAPGVVDTLTELQKHYPLYVNSPQRVCGQVLLRLDSHHFLKESTVVQKVKPKI